MSASSGALTLFLMTEKGYAFLQNTTPRFKSLFGLVVVGRDPSLQRDYEAEIIEFCIRNDIPWARAADQAKIETEYALAVSWRWMIDHPQDKLIVFHDALLPHYRGFSPLVNALINGETEIGVSAILGAQEFDTGPILAQSRSTIDYPIRIADAIKVVGANYRECAETVLHRLSDGAPLTGTAQDDDQATYSLWRDEHDYEIDWRRSAAEIRRFVDAVGEPYRGACTSWDGERVRILAAEEAPEVVVENRDCGKVLFVRDGHPVVVCGQGLLTILDAHIDAGQETRPLFPLPRFRMRFGG